jgi:hypothetical protein
MFFSWTARIVAIIVLLFSLLKLGISLSIILMPSAADRAQATLEYLGAGTAGFHFDRAVYQTLIAIALGTLAEMSFLLRAIRDK